MRDVIFWGFPKGEDFDSAPSIVHNLALNSLIFKIQRALAFESFFDGQILIF